MRFVSTPLLLAGRAAVAKSFREVSGRAVWSGSDGLGGHPLPLAVGVPDAAGDPRPKT